MLLTTGTRWAFHPVMFICTKQPILYGVFVDVRKYMKKIEDNQKNILFLC